MRVYLELKKRQVEENLLRDGYQEMYGMAKQIIDDFAHLDLDSFKKKRGHFHFLN